MIVPEREDYGNIWEDFKKGLTVIYRGVQAQLIGKLAGLDKEKINTLTERVVTKETQYLWGKKKRKPRKKFKDNIDPEIYLPFIGEREYPKWLPIAIVGVPSIIALILLLRR